MNEFLTQRDLLLCTEKFVGVEEMAEIAKQINRKIESDIGKTVAEQHKINEAICSENVLAKWFCSSELRSGNLVVWDRQVANTLPENFLWRQSEPHIVVSQRGYYRVELGFFAKKKPTVQLIVNGQTIVSAVNSDSYVLHHSSGKLKDVSNSEVVGLTFVDFLLLPEKARIAVAYIGEFPGEGFLSVHRI